MVPGKYVGSSDASAQNRERELISIPCVPEKEQAIEWHVKIGEIGRSPKSFIVFSDACNVPKKAETILTLDSIGFAEETPQFVRRRNAKFLCDPVNLIVQRGRLEREIRAKSLEIVAPHVFFAERFSPVTRCRERAPKSELAVEHS